MKVDAEQRLEARGTQLQGFSLRSVCWGYREIFARTIEQLFTEGLIGPHHTEVSRSFFDLLKHADQSCFDDVLKEFISAINPQTRWLLDVPSVFSEVVTLGRELAEHKLRHGITFFQIWGAGGFGSTPREVRTLISRMLRLRELDADLAIAFLRGADLLRSRLHEHELDRFLQEGMRLYHSNPAQAAAFLEGTSAAAENVIRTITRECRLDDVHDELVTLLHALVGYDVEVDHLGRLDSDELVERGSAMVCMYQWLYLPIVIRYFDQPQRNRAWFLLLAVVAAGMLAFDSFPRIHGHPDYTTCVDLVGNSPARVNALQVVEFTRIINAIRSRWPGARSLIALGLETECARRPPATAAEALLAATLAATPSDDPAVRIVHEAAAVSGNVCATATLLDQSWLDRLERVCPGFGNALLRPFSFLPDFLFPGHVDVAAQDQLVADLREQAATQLRDEETEADAHAAAASLPDPAARDEAGEQAEAAAVPACYIYDEWCQAENAYYTDYCRLFEQSVEPQSGVQKPHDIDADVRAVRQVFERLKPELAKKEKRLQEGDSINTERLVDFLVARRKEPAPRVDFYERPLTSQRDLAVLVLLDVSGSTGGTEHNQKIIDIEKRTALIFAEGLAALDDSFAVCGFSSNGHEQCEYYTYKEFGSAWDDHAIEALLSAFPSRSTRIGPALRHSGHKLAQQPNRRQLIILVTDGKPMDTGYDPHTRYAQYDIRKACQENERRGISTFAISTEENSRADMELMFPRGRFVILPDMRHLPAILPTLYLRITT